jgi:hypothetical protein
MEPNQSSKYANKHPYKLPGVHLPFNGPIKIQRFIASMSEAMYHCTSDTSTPKSCPLGNENYNNSKVVLPSTSNYANRKQMNCLGGRMNYTLLYG